MQAQVFQIAPAASKGMWGLIIVAAIILTAVLGMLTASALGARHARFEVSDEGLRLHGDLYGRLIPIATLQPSVARRVDFAATPGLEPTNRTMGTAMPGYHSGWFHLRGGERALVYLTDRTRAVYVPTTQGYSVVLSPADPDAFVAALHRLGGQKP